jgi:hypothetical protein
MMSMQQSIKLSPYMSLYDLIVPKIIHCDGLVILSTLPLFMKSLRIIIVLIVTGT